MARQKSAELTTAEQKIMELLWQHGEMTVRDINAVLNNEQPLAYTTVQTLCRILHDKGHVSVEKHGKAFVYKALTVQQEARSQALTALLKKFFGGSPALLAQHLITEDTLTPELAMQLQRKIDVAAKTTADDLDNKQSIEYTEQKHQD
jgi:BlaI family penicillinase repressor